MIWGLEGFRGTLAAQGVRTKRPNGSDYPLDPTLLELSKDSAGKDNTLATKQIQGPTPVTDTPMISSIIELRDEEVNAVGDPDEWEELGVMVDSGASHTVIGHDMVKAVEPTGRKPGVSYQLADGIRVPHMEEKSFKAYTDGSLLLPIEF